MAGMTFKVEPRHVGMFGSQGVLRPLYERQAQKFALSEEERRIQAQFEQMKALTQLRANLETQLQAADPYRQAQTKETEAMAALRGFQLEQAKGEDVATADFARNYAAATPEERPEIVRQEFARRGILQGLMPQEERQYAPQRSTFLLDPQTGMPVLDKEGNPVAVPGAVRFLPKTSGQSTGLTFEQKRGLRKDITSEIKTLFGEKDIIPGKLAKELGIEKQAIDRYLSTFSGKPWSPEQVKAYGKLKGMKDAISTTIVSILDRLWDIEMSDLGAGVDTTQVPTGATGWEQFIQGQTTPEGQVGAIAEMQGAPPTEYQPQIDQMEMMYRMYPWMRPTPEQQPIQRPSRILSK